MTRDAIIDEVRAIRDEIAKEHGYDIHELFKAFRRAEATSGRAHVSFLARRCATGVAAQQGNAAAASLGNRATFIATDVSDEAAVDGAGPSEHTPK